MVVEFDCVICGKHIRKQWSASMPGKPTYCSIACKAQAQRQQKPVDRAWLYQKYVVEGLGTPDIAQLVNRHPKRVWEWLRNLDIPTRPRGAHTSRSGFKRGHKLNEGKSLSPQTRQKIREACLRNGRVPYIKGGVHHLKGKRGPETPNWKGGITPQRQRLYSMPEWSSVVKQIWKRDGGRCRRCGISGTEARRAEIDMDIHHVVGFEVVELRMEPTNLMLLCDPCHHWVHSRRNTEREFIR